MRGLLEANKKNEVICVIKIPNDTFPDHNMVVLLYKVNLLCNFTTLLRHVTGLIYHIELFRVDEVTHDTLPL